MLLNQLLLLVFKLFDLSVNVHLLLVVGGLFLDSLVQEISEIIQVMNAVD